MLQCQKLTWWNDLNICEVASFNVAINISYYTRARKSKFGSPVITVTSDSSL